jgi:Na+/H+-dicarboxylate symporter
MTLIPLIRRFLHKSWAIPASIILAFLVSLVAPNFSKSISDFGDLYISFFLLAILPYLSISIIISISNFIPVNNQLLNIKKWMFVYITLYCFSSISGMVIAHFSNFGVEIASQKDVSEVVRNSRASQLEEINLNTPLEDKGTKGIITFLVKSVPSNIFNALSQGTMVQIIVFSVLFGLAFVFMPETNKKYMREFLENAGMPFRKFIDAAILCLPIGLFFIMSKYISSMKDPTVVIYLWKYLIAVIISFILISLLVVYLASRKLKISFLNSFAVIKHASVIALSTAHSIAAMPSLIDGLKERTRLRSDTVGLVIPVGISLFQFGPIFYYSFLTIFVTQVYDIHLEFSAYMLILVAVYFAAVAETEIPLASLAIVFVPLGLPVVFLALFMVLIDWLVDPFRTLFTIIMNYWGCVMTVDNDEKLV